MTITTPNMSTPTSFPDYHDLAVCETATAAQCRHSCGFPTMYFGVGGPKDKFPVVLYALLEKAATDQFDDVISWQPHGRAFKIHDYVKLEKDILSKYLRRPIKYASFQRNLHLYGFLQLPFRGLDAGCYYHECFLLGRSDLCSLMQRATKSTCHVRQSRDPSTAPNFGNMLTTNEAQVALQLSNAINLVPAPSIMMKPKTIIVAQGHSHDAILLRNANDTMVVATTTTPPNNVVECEFHDTFSTTPIQCSLPVPHVVVAAAATATAHGHRANHNRDSVAPTTGREERCMLLDLRRQLDHSQQEYLLSLFGETQSVSPTEMTNKTLPLRDDKSKSCGATGLTDSKPAAFPARTCDKQDASLCASKDNKSSQEETGTAAIQRDEHIAQTAACPCDDIVNEDDTNRDAAMPPKAPMAASGNELPSDAPVERDSAPASVYVDDLATVEADDGADFTMTDELQAIVGELYEV